MQHFRVISALKPLYTASTIAMFAPPNTCPRGGMVDTRDLKSLGLVGRAGSSPAAGTTCWVIFHLKQSVRLGHPILCTFLCTLLLTIEEFFGTPAGARIVFCSSCNCQSLTLKRNILDGQYLFDSAHF